MLHGWGGERLSHLAGLIRSFVPVGTASLLSTLVSAATARAMGSAQDEDPVDEAAVDHLLPLLEGERPFRLGCLAHLVGGDLEHIDDVVFELKNTPV